jgi:hypothetical protein
MNFSKIGIGMATFALVASMSVAGPKPAAADEASTAAIAGIAGLVAGALLFDSSSNRYYYNNGGHRRYVSDVQARQYYQHRDPQYFNAHRSQWNNHRQFQSGWEKQHGRDRDHNGR